MERTELITHLEHLAEYVKYSEDAPALWEAIALLKTHEERTETHARVLISMADVDQTVEDNILYYTHSDRPIDQDPDTECHKAIRTALKMLRKDLRKLPPVQPDHSADVSKMVNGDAVSRQAAIEALYKKAFRLTVAEEYCHEGHVAWSANVVYRDVMEGALLELPSAQLEPHWIPCSERLPKYGCPVLWCNENESVFVSAITVKTDHGWAIGKRHRMCKVIAWMPLPEPYQTEKVGIIWDNLMRMRLKEKDGHCAGRSRKIKTRWFTK